MFYKHFAWTMICDNTQPKWPELEFRAMSPGWNNLSDELQLALANAALTRAAASIAAQAEVLADEFERGNLADRGGADALRLFAAVVRNGGKDELAAAGHA
jgi:hypothetical protein